jgi:histone H3/H4
MNYLVKSRVKDSTEMNVSNTAIEKLNERIERLVEDAEERAEGNDRTTLMDRDF